MDNTTPPTNTNTDTRSVTPLPVTPFPASNTASNATGPAAKPATSGTTTSADAAAAAPLLVDRLIQRATSSAHDAVDSMAAKVSSLTDGLEGGVSKVSNTRDEWVEAARDAIRQRPIAAVAGALLVGAALLSLSSSRRT